MLGHAIRRSRYVFVQLPPAMMTPVGRHETFTIGPNA